MAPQVLTVSGSSSVSSILLSLADQGPPGSCSGMQRPAGRPSPSPLAAALRWHAGQSRSRWQKVREPVQLHVLGQLMQV